VITLYAVWQRAGIPEFVIWFCGKVPLILEISKFNNNTIKLTLRVFCDKNDLIHSVF